MASDYEVTHLAKHNPDRKLPKKAEVKSFQDSKPQEPEGMPDFHSPTVEEYMNSIEQLEAAKEILDSILVKLAENADGGKVELDFLQWGIVHDIVKIHREKYK